MADGVGSEAATSGDGSATAGSGDDCNTLGFVNDCDTADSGDGCGTARRSGNVRIGPVSAGQDDPVTGPSDSNSDSGGIGSELARWLVPSAVGRSTDSSGACHCVTEDLDELAREVVHVHQPIAAAPRRTAAEAKAKNGTCGTGPLRGSVKAGLDKGGAWAIRCADTSANRFLSHFCCQSASLKVWRQAAHSRAWATIPAAGDSPSISAILDWTSWHFINRYASRASASA